MSKCWYCNNELTTGDSPKHFGICNKCYDGMFKSSDTIIRSFTNKISDLEAKLAKSEKERELDNAFWKQECDSLQKTLVEKDKEIESLKDNWNVLCDYLGDCVVKYDEEDVNGIYGEVLDKVNILKRYDYKRYQDKISFTIQQLEKVKELCREKFNWWENSEWEGNIYDKSDVSNAYFDIEANIDQQIELLKGKVEDVKD